MVTFYRQSLVAKLLTLILAVGSVGLTILALITVRLQTDSMERVNRRSARAIAQGLTAGVRSAMLSGNGLAVRQLLGEAKTGMDAARVRVYSSRGEEVFGEKPPAPAPELQPEHVRTALRTATASLAAGGATALPIANEQRCKTCHEQGALRGVLTMGLKSARVPFQGEARLDALSQIARAGFVQIMTARKDRNLDEYFKDLARTTPGVKGVAIYSNDPERTRFFGDDSFDLAPALLDRAMKPGPAFTSVAGELTWYVQPLENESRCKGCHKDPHEVAQEVRGAMVVAFEPRKLGGEETLLKMSQTSLQHVMLSGLGRLVTGFLDQTAATGVVSTLTLHDAEGRLYHDALAAPARPPATVSAALDAKEARDLSEFTAEGHSQFLYVEPMLNEPRCQRCHGADQPLRGAIAVSLDQTEQVMDQRKATGASATTAVVMLLIIFVLLYRLVKHTVLEPVFAIGSVADQVGEGKLDARVAIISEDEIGRLAGRLNDMVEGLRRKLELSKFVSKETLKSVEAQGNVSRTGQRLRVTVLFSDIRGFTAFSETRQPEQVVDMLNRYLHVQAEVVIAHGGDIDKFVGDELMARFTGEGAEARATRCAVEMIEAVDKLNATLPPTVKGIAIGVGVNAGDVVLGAMGAENRMDFTVIGDAVNLGARLCSAAERGQVLVSGYARGSFGELPGIELVPLEPIKVKGKVEPIAIFAARRPGK